MKTVAITGERRAETIDVPKPKAQEDWAVVKVHVAPMCTEYKNFMSGKPGHCHGHEAVGEVVEIAQPGRVKVGDRVVVQPQYPCGRCFLCRQGDFILCRNNADVAGFLGSAHGSGMMSQYAIKPSWLLTPIPDDIGYEHASLALCALGPTFGAYEKMGIGPEDTLLVTGLGPVGLGGVLNARLRGARVIAVDMNEWRRGRALELGADAAFDPREDGLEERLRGLTDRGGIDAAMDCSGALQAQKLGLMALRRGGRFACVQANKEEAPAPFSHLIWNGLTVHGAWHYNIGDFRKVMEVIRRAGPARLNKLISHVFPMSRIQEAFEALASQETAKVLLKPWE